RRNGAAGRSPSIGLFNVVGSIATGVLGSRLPKHYLLSLIHFLRALAITGFMLAPMSPVSTMTFRRRDGSAVALDRAAHLRPGRPDVRPALHGDAVRLRALLPPGGIVYWRLARRLPL